MRTLSAVTTKKSLWKGSALIGSIAAMFLLAACGDDSKSSSGNDDAEIVSDDDADIVSIADKTISGVSQKGPFVNGSSVTVQELDGESLAQTGASYEGKIKNDMGEFSVKVANLASQYALLKANGFYRNEVTGEKSTSQVTLYALTDLSDRDEVNVNLLTHLEYERSLYLVSEGLSVGKAKKQAESEVLGSFGIEGNFASAEDLSIFGTDEGAAALLAVSVLMQGDLNEANFSERLANYAADIEEDGKWDDFITVTAIADWASNRSLTGALTAIRDNIAGWGLSADVPAFEKYVDRYWWQVYSLDFCDKDREGEVMVAKNALSGNNGVHFICGNGAWKIATNIEKDTATWGPGKFDGEVRAGQVDSALYYIYSSKDEVWRKASTLELDTYDYENNKDWGDGTSGEIKPGSVTKNVYVYDSTGWRVASNIEKVLGGCVSATEDSLGKVGGDYYICSLRRWKEATDVQVDTYHQECSKFGQIVHGNINKDNLYFCYGNEWKHFYGGENVKYGKLVDERDGQIYRTTTIGNQVWMAENLNYASSSDKECRKGDSYCEERRSVYGVSYSWGEAIDAPYWSKQGLDCENYSGFCVLPEKVQGVCPEGWHIPSKEEWDLLDSVTGKSIKPVYLPKDCYECGDKDVINEVLGVYDDEYGFSLKMMQEEKRGLFSKFWSSSHEYGAWTIRWDGWNEKKFIVSNENVDWYENQVRCVKGDGIKTAPLACTSKNIGDTTSATRIGDGNYEYLEYFICGNDGWKGANEVEYLKGFCTTEREGNAVSVAHLCYNDREYFQYFICRNKVWKDMPEVEYLNGSCTSKREGDTVSVTHIGDGCEEYLQRFICRNKAWENVQEVEYLNGSCTSEREGDTASVDGSYYKCQNKAWRDVSHVEYSYGSCTSEREGDTASVDGSYYKCQNKAWRNVSHVEYSYDSCTSEREGDTASVDGSYYKCQNKTWKEISSLEYQYGPCTNERTGDTASAPANNWGWLGGILEYYMCKNESWEKVTHVEYSYGLCTGEKEGDTANVDGIYYKCKNKAWKEISSLEYQYGPCTNERTGDTASVRVNSWGMGVDGTIEYYMCKNESWEKVTHVEYSYGLCSSENAGDTSSFYVCDNNMWKPISGEFVDERDERSYHFVAIGEQVWMAENLDYDTTGAKCFENDIANCEVYGKLYPSSIAQAVCPAGWHLPDEAEFRQLVDFTGNSFENLKSTDWGGTDAYGFAALQAGKYDAVAGGSFTTDQYSTGWWLNSSETSGFCRLYGAENNFTIDDCVNGFSVRCVKDSE